MPPSSDRVNLVAHEPTVPLGPLPEGSREILVRARYGGGDPTVVRMREIEVRVPIEPPAPHRGPQGTAGRTAAAAVAYAGVVGQIVAVITDELCGLTDLAVVDLES